MIFKDDIHKFIKIKIFKENYDNVCDEDIFEWAKETLGIEKEQVLLELEELENEGNIYRPRHNCYKPTTK
jgi:DNA replicative helicase MCM subunit Mcm2 (Cdc46/Mcm family)